MVTYRRDDGRELTLLRPDARLDASTRWERVEPEQAPETGEDEDPERGEEA